MVKQHLYLLLLTGLVALGTTTRVEARTSSSLVGGATQSAVDEPYLLNEYPNAYAAYSLRKLRSDYTGPAIRVRRSSDDVEQDIGFTSDGWVDTEALESFVGSGDGFVTTWYAQVGGTPNMVQSNPTEQPYAARGGIAETDAEGKPAFRFEGGDRLQAGPFSSPIQQNDYTFWGIIDIPTHNGEAYAFGLGEDHQGAFYRFSQSYINTASVRFGDESNSIAYELHDVIFLRNTGSEANIWQGNTMHADLTLAEDDGLDDPSTSEFVTVGGGFEGTFSELVAYPSVTQSRVLDFYSNVAADWGIGPVTWNEDALLPQQFDYQVVLYDWLETLTVDDVTLQTGQTLTYDNNYGDEDELADLWMQVEGLSASSATRGEPEWYVLDAGNGQGIEAMGSVKVWHEPRGDGSYGGNPPRSWQNEPAYLYQLDIPLAGGGQGNPYFQDPALGRRAMVVAMVDLMMHHDNLNTSTGWFDMVGKAFLGMAEAYRYAKGVLPSEEQDAFEEGAGYILDHLIQTGPRAVNTNMDMFAIQGAADFYMATDNSTLKDKCVQLVKRVLFGHTDGVLETNHDVFAVGDRTGGVFDPSGFIMEGDQPEVFYGGESIYHVAGALSAVADPQTGDLPADWAFLEDVLSRLQEWRTYQYFYDPGVAGSGVGDGPATLITAGAGFTGRTSYGVPHGQAGDSWKNIFIADRFASEFAHKAESIPNVSDMESEIANKLSYITNEMSSPYVGTPNDWNGWSPWTKQTPYMPREGWYSRIKALIDTEDPSLKPPVAQSGVYYNKTFGGSPVGNQYWAYKDTDGSREWGFFLEAQAKQGGYGGWYGGKIETFWTETTGVILLNRHGKTGCDNDTEDSVCFNNLDEKAAQHVWGRDENGNGFTTLLLRGWDLQRTSTFDTDASIPSVTVNNVFNDPSVQTTSSRTGEETGSEIEGNFEIENTFEALADGVRVTHTLSSDGSDQVTELWASLPVYLRHYNPLRAGTDKQEGLEDTSIEYWDGAAWQVMPEDQDGDGVPELVTATALRLGRDFQLGDGIQYAYVAFDASQQVRLSTGIYYDPYQSKSGVRTVHIDLHGSPGTTQPLPTEKSVSYTVQTTHSTDNSTPTPDETLDIALQEGWNLVSTTVAPNDANMETLFEGISTDVEVVHSESGAVYDPGSGTNDIGNWNTGEAYAVFNSDAATLSMQGVEIDPASTPLALQEGWNWIPYLPTRALPVSEALEAILDHVVAVKDEAGKVYYPAQNIDNIGDMQPGKGYKIYVSQDTNLTYPDGN